MARRDRPECVWTRAPHAPLKSREDVVLTAQCLIFGGLIRESGRRAEAAPLQPLPVSVP